MLRKVLIALAATAAIGVAMAPTASMAQRGGGHGGGGFHAGGGFHGGGGFRGGFGGRGFAGRGFRGGFGGFYPGFGVYGPYAYYGGGYPYDDSCYRLQRIRTPYGLRWRRAYVCY